MTPPPTSATPHVPPSAGGTSQVHDIVERARSGDRVALGLLFDRYHARVFAYLMALLRHRQDAEDAMSETFLIAWRQLPGFEWTGAPFSSWLLGIARRHATGSRRRAHNQDTSLDSTHHDDPSDDQILPAATHIDIVRALDDLPPDQQEILLLRFYGGLSAASIAELTGRTAGAVRQLQFRACERLARGGKLANHGAQL